MTQDEQLLWVNGELVAGGSAGVRPEDRGLLYGDGLFETMRAYGGRVFCLTEHLDRLLTSAGLLQMPLQYGKDALAAAVADTLAANEVADAYVRLTVTRGVGGRPSELDAPQACTVIITVREYHGYPAHVYDEGLKLTFAQARRNETSLLSRIKSLNYLDNIIEQHQAKQGGYDEAIFLNTQGIVAEGATSNVFIVEKGRTLTPPLAAGVLPGIVRGCLLAGMDMAEEAFGPERLAAADEVFLTNSLLEVAPAISLDGCLVGGGVPGPVYHQAHELYRRLLSR